MNSVWRKTIVFILFCFGATIACSSLTDRKLLTTEGLQVQTLLQSPSLLKQNRVDSQSLLVGQKPPLCQSINPEYRDFYNFETHNYNISICRQGEEWFYYRESKTDSDDALILSATVVFGGDVFQAIDGKTTYFVGINSDGYYSSVMYGNERMIFEPELPKNSTTATTTATQKPQKIVNSVEVSTPKNVDLQSSDFNTGYWRVCTEDRDDLHPYLNGWQKFIGKSPNVISEYATIKGHSFSYSNFKTDAALVETTDGLMVTLDLTQIGKTIGGVCVKPIASF
jgi:hypothetical protein